MGDRRHKNANWQLPEYEGPIPFDACQLAVMMDIRDELQEANRSLARIRNVLECTNARRGFIAMHKLRKHLEAAFPPRVKRGDKKRVAVLVRRRKAKGAK